MTFATLGLATGAFVTLVAGFRAGAFATLLTGFRTGAFATGLDFPKKESRSASAVEAAWSPKLELVFETVCSFCVGCLLAADVVLLAARPPSPRGLSFVLFVDLATLVDLAAFFVLLCLLLLLRIPVLATVSFLFSQTNGSGSDATLTELDASTFFVLADAWYVLAGLVDVSALDPKGLNNIAIAPTPTTTNPDTNTDEFTESPRSFRVGS